MGTFHVRDLYIYPEGGVRSGKGELNKDMLLLVYGKPDWEGYHSIESVSLSDDEVDALHEWLGKVIEDRKIEDQGVASSVDEGVS